MNFIEITFNNIKSEIESYLQIQHNKGNILFSPSSPYGQTLSIIENLHQLSFLYLKNAIDQFDLNTQNSLNERVIRNAAITAGHIPGRGISATGTLKLTPKSNIDLDADIPGGRITISNQVEIKNITNGLSYLVNLGVEKVVHKITSNYSFFLPIIQGKLSLNTRTGSGDVLQTFNFSEPTSKDVENFNVQVLVNGVYWSIKTQLWDMMANENACVVRTGFNGGIDVIFGNGSFGSIPPLSSIIQINYIITNGSSGNIYRRTINDWKIVGDVLDGYGNVIDLTKVFDINIYTDINFGADKESLAFTRNILPIVSNNFVLALPQQYAYQIKKLGVFSHVNAYEENSTIFVVATPNIKLFKSPDSDYFTIDIRAFSLDDYEKSKIDSYLKNGSNIQLTKKYRITSPDISYYVMNVFVMPYSDASNDSVNAQILQVISDYFLNLSRIDRIPKLDIIRALSSLSDIHSVDIQFICKKNEDYHKQAQIDAQNRLNKYNSRFQTDISINTMLPDYIPTETKGLDPILGDIIFNPNEIPIIRGGWYDRNSIFYSDDISGNTLKSVNIINQGTVDSKNRPM